MFTQFFNLRNFLAVVAIAIITGTIFYSNYLGKKIAKEEREKVSRWIEANKFILAAGENVDLTLAANIQQQTTDIPIIVTNEKDSIIDSRNMDSLKTATEKNYLQDKLQEFRSAHQVIVMEYSKVPYVANRFYYGDSELLKEVRYYPIIQLIIVALFIIITLIAITTRNKSTQNQVWAGMAKETAHQLGTPISSLQGWVEMLKTNPDNEKIANEMAKDVNRLELVSDRFGKIGSIPQLEEKNIILQLENMVAYIKRRATDKVSFNIDSGGQSNIPAMINGPLFDWVIENLLKNALDAMDGKGSILITVKSEVTQITIDVADSGKGITKQNISKVFKPGFTTKKRGWGLGLSLSKRIIDQYHKGELFIRSSEPGKGTTFRIILKN